MNALTTGASALAGLFDQGEEEKARQRDMAMQDLALADEMYARRRRRNTQTTALDAASRV